MQKFERGNTLTTLEVIGESKGTGTTIHFKPDNKILKL